MSPVFADTGWLIAVIDPRDALHDAALEVARTLEGATLLTSDAVFLELGSYFARSHLRAQAGAALGAMRTRKGWEVAPVDRPLLLAAEDRYRTHADKDWSLTDCLSMEIMKARGIKRIAAHDHGFEQAGFEILLK